MIRMHGCANVRQQKGCLMKPIFRCMGIAKYRRKRAEDISREIMQFFCETRLPRILPRETCNACEEWIKPLGFCLHTAEDKPFADAVGRDDNVVCLRHFQHCF